MAEIIVPEGFYERARAPDELFSGFVVSSIAVGAIYQGAGAMTHEIPIGVDYAQSLVPFFTGLRRKGRAPRTLQFYVIGGTVLASDDPAAREAILRGRELVLEAIAAHGFEEVPRTVQWGKPTFSQSLRLLLAEGQAEIEERQNPDSRLSDEYIHPEDDPTPVRGG